MGNGSRSGVRRPGRAGPGSALPGLPLGGRRQGEARPLREDRGLRRRGGGRGDRPRQARGEPALGEGGIGRDAPEVGARGCREVGTQGLDRGRGALGDRPDRSLSGDDRQAGRSRLVVAPADPGDETSGSGGRGPGANAHRCLSPAVPGGDGAEARARGRASRADPAPDLRPDRPPARAGGGGPVRPGPFRGCVREARRSIAGVAAIRGTLGALVAGPRPVRREQRIRIRRIPPLVLEISRLGGRGIQPGHAL